MVRPLSLPELAALVGAESAPDLSLRVTGAAPLDVAQGSDVSFLESRAYLEQAHASKAGVILCREPLRAGTAASLVVPNPREAFVLCLQHFHEARERRPGVHTSAAVEPSARISEGAEIGALAVVGANSFVGTGSVIEAGVLIGDGVEVGSDCRIHRGAKILDGVRLGDRVIVQSGAVIGSDGFGFIQDDQGRHRKIPHNGTVRIEDDVEIGACCCIDRGVAGDTTIGAGSKLDNLVHVAHNVKVGRNCLLVAQVGISGSVTIGDGSTLAGKVGVAGHLEIGAGAVIAAAARVVRSVPAGATVAGWPALEVGLWRRSVALFRRLPAIWQRLQAIEQRIGLNGATVESEASEDPSDGAG
jgi:UDP-3-O-[3-hydroxymyristoyl] glucosamine N-acyltransferase